MTAMLVRGQRVFARGSSGVVLDSAAGCATVELHDGRIVIVAEREIIPAENAESVKQREGGKR